MSYYYKYNFISPEATYALVKEELKSYFDTGAIDDLLFPTYLNKCLNKLGKSSYRITEQILFIEDFTAPLPDNFQGIREAWMCEEISLRPFQGASAFYSQAYKNETIQVAPVTYSGPACPNENCVDEKCGGCKTELAPAIYKTITNFNRTFKQSYLLVPGNISAANNCSADYTSNLSVYGQNCNNPYSSTYNSFDIRDNKFVTNFRQEVVHILYYANDTDDCGNQLVPDNYRVLEYVEAFIKYKVMEMLTNQVNDETVNQLERKLDRYKQMSDEAYVMAESEIKKQTLTQKINSIRRQNKRFDKYRL
jgi:hypothetical protein